MRHTTIILAAVVALAGTAVAGNQYEDAALAKAKADKLKAKQVAEMGYPEIAQLAGVTLGPKGESPAKFFYVHVRRHVQRDLAATEKAARIAEQLDKVEKKIKEAFPDAEIEVSEDGKEFKIKNVPPDPEEVTP